MIPLRKKNSRSLFHVSTAGSVPYVSTMLVGWPRILFIFRFSVFFLAVCQFLSSCVFLSVFVGYKSVRFMWYIKTTTIWFWGHVSMEAVLFIWIHDWKGEVTLRKALHRSDRNDGVSSWGGMDPYLSNG